MKSFGKIVFVLLLSFLAPTSWGAEQSPFLRVTNWIATFTHTLNVNGELTYAEPGTEQMCTATWRYNHAMTVSGQMAVDPSTISLPNFRLFTWKQTDAASVFYNDKFERTCGDQFHSHIVKDNGGVPTNFFLTIDTSRNEYVVSFPPQRTIPGESEVRYDDIRIPGNIGIGWAPADQTTNNLPSTNQILHGDASFPMSQWYLAITEASGAFIQGDPRFGGTHPLTPTLLNGNLRITWSLQPQISEPELIVEPQGYSSWRPEAGRDEETAGNSIQVKVTLKNKDGSPATVKAEKFIFELLETSREPGVCMNFPLKVSAKTSFDLQMRQGNNPSTLTVQTNGQKAETIAGEYTTYTMMLTSLDWGGWTKLRATAVLPGGEQLVGHLINEPSVKEVPIPKRKDGSNIAETWFSQSGATGNDEADDESDPEGDGNAGDGLTLYEEYRGFHENGKHIEGKPKKKDYFLLNLIGADAEGGVWLFSELTGLEVHKDLQRDELADDRLINANTDQGAHSVDQHGVIMKTANVKGAIAYDEAGSPPGPPKNTEVVLIEPRDKEYGLFGEWQGNQLKLKAVDSLQSYDRAVAHELMHTVGVWHHGEGDYTRIWRWYHSSVSPDGRPYFVSIKQVNGDITDGSVDTRIKVTHEESGRDFAQVVEERMGPSMAASPELYPNKTILFHPVYVGKPGGQHSGADDCVMRYYFALAYEVKDRANEFYIFEHQSIGLELDDSPKGTGNNASDHAPQSRFFDASVSRGDRHQIVVNDKANPTKP